MIEEAGTSLPENSLLQGKKQGNFEIKSQHHRFLPEIRKFCSKAGNLQGILSIRTQVFVCK